MLTLFPSLLTYHLLAPFLIRLGLGLFLAGVAWKKILRGNRKQWVSAIFMSETAGGAEIVVGLVGLVELAAAVGLIVGFYTQLAAIIAGLSSLRLFFIQNKTPLKGVYGNYFYFLLILLSLSLLFSGAGAFAFDLPL